MALRLDFTPSNFTLIQLDLPVRSLRKSEEGPLGVLTCLLVVVAIADVVVVLKMRVESTEVFVQVIIAGAGLLARLLHAIVAQGRTPQDAFLAKSSVTIVHKRKTWSGVAGN